MEVLERLPERVSAVELQLVQLRDEMRAEFSATRASDDETRRLLRDGEEETRRLLREGDEETRRYMRILHEDVIARISMLERPRRSRKKRDPEP